MINSSTPSPVGCSPPTSLPVAIGLFLANEAPLSQILKARHSHRSTPCGPAIALGYMAMLTATNSASDQIQSMWKRGRGTHTKQMQRLAVHSACVHRRSTSSARELPKKASRSKATEKEEKHPTKRTLRNARTAFRARVLRHPAPKHLSGIYST